MKTALFTIASLLVLALGFAACGDDTDPNPPPTDSSVATTDGELPPTADAGDPSLPDCKVEVADLHAFYDGGHNGMLDVFNWDKPIAVDSTVTVTVNKMAKSGKPDSHGFFTIHMVNIGLPTVPSLTVTVTIAGPSCKSLDVSLKTEPFKVL